MAADFFDGKVGCFQEVFGIVDAKLGYVFVGSESGVFFKASGHVGAAYAKVVGEVVRSEVFHIVCLYVGNHFFNDF